MIKTMVFKVFAGICFGPRRHGLIARVGRKDKTSKRKTIGKGYGREIGNFEMEVFLMLRGRKISNCQMKMQHIYFIGRTKVERLEIRQFLWLQLRWAMFMLRMYNRTQGRISTNAIEESKPDTFISSSRKSALA